MPASIAVSDEPELSPADEYRERVECARRTAQSRYLDRLAGVVGQHGAAEPGAVMAALTARRYVDSGERCWCSCHPRLPDGDLRAMGLE